MTGSDTDAGAGGRRHSEIPPELRQLAQVLLDRLDPAIRLIAAQAASQDATPGLCQQVWCPVCGLAALLAGEQHPLVSVIAEHGAELLAVLRTMVAVPDPTGPESSGTPPPPADGDRPPQRPGRYEHIPVSVQE